MKRYIFIPFEFQIYLKTFLEIVCFYDIEVTGLSLAIVYFEKQWYKGYL